MDDVDISWEWGQPKRRKLYRIKKIISRTNHKIIQEILCHIALICTLQFKFVKIKVPWPMWPEI